MLIFSFLPQEWSAEGYQLWMLRETPAASYNEENKHDSITNINDISNHNKSLILLDFVKSPLTINPCMVNAIFLTTCKNI